MSSTINGGSGGRSQNMDKICIDVSKDLEEHTELWEKHAVIARIIGLNWSREDIKNWVECNWGRRTVTKFIPKGFFVVLFEEEKDRDQVLNQENWFVNDHAIYLQPWFPNFDPLPLVVYSAPIWIRLYNLPIEYWSENVLEKIGRNLGNLLEIDFDDEANLCKISHLRIAAVKRVPATLTLITASREWKQQVEIEKQIKQCPRCGSKFHGQEACKMFVRKARKVANDEEEKVLVLGDCDDGSFLNNRTFGESEVHPSFNPSCRGVSDTEFEFEKGSEDGFLQEYELEKIDPRCISQLANALLGKAKGLKGRKSNRQKREARAGEKGVISVLEFMKKSKGDRFSLSKG
ncbi:hypothetical protein SUGI_0401220 [Cryptomeria japonica]|nr:hypothetical protein SUGI_0401220 [Cryptomeria japonica]